jgi:hypothetical protein
MFEIQLPSFLKISISVTVKQTNTKNSSAILEGRKKKGTSSDKTWKIVRYL